MPKVITIGSYKGGVGKTTTAVSLAGILAEMDYCVLCVDMDPSGNLTSGLGINRLDTNMLGIEQIFTKRDGVDIKDILIESPIEEEPTLDLIPSTLALAEAEDTLWNLPGKEFKFKYFLEDNKEELKHYDYIIVDTHPNVGIINQNALVESNNIIMAATPDIDAVDGMIQFCERWDKVRLSLRIDDNVGAVVITRVDKRNSIDKNFRDYLVEEEEQYGLSDILMDTTIPISVALREAAVKSMPINIYDSKSTGAVAYRELVEELLKKGVL